MAIFRGIFLTGLYGPEAEVQEPVSNPPWSRNRGYKRARTETVSGQPIYHQIYIFRASDVSLDCRTPHLTPALPQSPSRSLRAGCEAAVGLVEVSALCRTNSKILRF